MELRHLRIFVAIVESGSLSAAAKLLHSSPPSLSARLKELEEEFGLALFKRQARGLSLTDEGHDFLTHAYAILKQVEDAKTSMLNRDRPVAGEVRFGVPVSLAGFLTVPLIEAGRARLPNVRLRVIEAHSAPIASWLREGSLDAAILFGGRLPTDRSAALQPIAEEELTVATYDADIVAPYLDRDGRIPLAALRHFPMVLPGPEQELRALIDAVARRYAIPLNVAIEVDAPSSIFEFVRRGYGVTIWPVGPQHGFGAYLPDQTLHKFSAAEPDLKRIIYLATPLNRPSSRATTAVAKLVDRL